MKKRTIFVLFLLIVMALSACATFQSNETITDPPETTGEIRISDETQAGEEATTDPVQIDDNALTAGELAEFQELFDFNPESGAVWYNLALTSQYATPEDINLYALFFNGFLDAEVEDWECTALYAMGFPEEMDIQKNPVDRMETVLMDYFGLTLEQTNGNDLDVFYYLEETDSYYNCAGGLNCYDNLSFLSGWTDEDGTIHIRYTALGQEFVVTLQPAPEGSTVPYRILSNLPAE